MHGVVNSPGGLMIFFFPRFRDRGVQEVRLEVIQTNARAIRVYEKVGFEIVRITSVLLEQ